MGATLSTSTLYTRLQLKKLNALILHYIIILDIYNIINNDLYTYTGTRGGIPHFRHFDIILSFPGGTPKLKLKSLKSHNHWSAMGSENPPLSTSIEVVIHNEIIMKRATPP